MEHQEQQFWGEKAWVSLLSKMPLRSYSQWMGALADIPIPLPFRDSLWGLLASRFGMNLAEAEYEPRAYESFNALFTRKLKPGIRSLADDENAIISPVDATISALGCADRDRLLQAKGVDYSIYDLLGDDEFATRLAGGSYITFYLQPKDYHRIHAPCDAQLITCRRWPGSAFPVQPHFQRHLKGLFVRNERVVLELDSHLGRIAAVFVGAAAVSAITTPFEDGQLSYKAFDTPIDIKRGDEIGVFNLGSTVILIFEPQRIELNAIEVGESVQMGQALATLAANT